MNSIVHKRVDRNAAARRIRSKDRRRRSAFVVTVLFGALVLNHLWWISPTLRVMNDGSLSADEAMQFFNNMPRKNVYIGTGNWRNRGLNLAGCIASMLSNDETTIHGETIQVTIRKLQILHLGNESNNSSHVGYLRELRGTLYPSLCSYSNDTLGRAEDGYHDFCSQTLPEINAWTELDSILKSSSGNRSAISQRRQLVKNAAKAKEGDEVAASLLASELTRLIEPFRNSDYDFLVQQNSEEAAVLNGPSVAVLTGSGLQQSDVYNANADVVGFELRKRVDDNASSIPVVDLAFYKQHFEIPGGGGGDAVAVLRPDPRSNVSCIVERDSKGVLGHSSFYECEPRDESGISDRTEPLPLVGLVFGPDFVGGCKAASRMLDSYRHFSANLHDQKDDRLWSQEIQNVISSVSVSLRTNLYVASFGGGGGDDGAQKVRCDSVASFWSSASGNDDYSLWQSYRNVASSGIGLDLKLAQCLVRLPLEHFPSSKVVNQTHGTADSLLAFGGRDLQNTCYGPMGSTCTIAIDEATLCELTCEHSGSYAVSLGIESASGSRHHGPTCFELERKLETPLDRNRRVAWLAQQDADPVRWAQTRNEPVEEERRSVTLVFTSDVHGRFFQECGTSYCYPGAPHIASVIQTIRSAESRSGMSSPVVLLDAGDATFGSQYNETLVGMTMNRLGYDTMALGNHELDVGRQRLDAFADLANFPIISANVNGVPFTTDFVRVALKGGATLCIVGVSANEYNPLAGRKVSYDSDDAFVTKMVRDLRTQHGCNHTLLLSHVGIEADKRFAKEGSIDAIIGGHSHVLMGVRSDDSKPESSEFGAVTDMNFPFISDNGSPVAHSGANGRYIGLLRLSWVGAQLLDTKGSLIPIDDRHGVFADYDFHRWQSKLVAEKNHLDRTDSSKISVDSSLPRNELCGQTCRNQECLIGNLATDAMVSCAILGPCSENSKAPNVVATLALLESGTLRACLAPDVEDFAEVLPWPNNLVLLTMTGASVRKMLEHGLRDMKEGQGGAYLQTSGLKYTYRGTSVDRVLLFASSIGPPLDQRPIISFSARSGYQADMCGLSGMDSRESRLDDESLYRVVVTDWLASGGDGYQPFLSSAAVDATNTTLRDAILQYAQSHPTVRVEARSGSMDSKLPTSTKQGISGFFGGAVSFLTTYPLYTLFVQRSASKKLSFSLDDLFAGSILGMFATALSQAIYFCVYSSSILMEYSTFVRATFAAVTNSAVTTPLWVIVTHLQMEQCQTGVVDVAKHVYLASGLPGFFAGFSMNILMCIFPVVRQIILELFVSTFELKRHNRVAAAAAVSSWLATLLTFPIQQIRIRMQTGEGHSLRGHYFDGVVFKLMHSCSTSFVLFLVKQHSENLLCILEG